MESNLPWSEQFRIVAFEQRLIPEPNSGCWLWLGMQQVGKEYGLFCFKQRTVKAHRASWEIYCGEIPVGMSVLHKCDNPPCVNPDHLFLGSQSDNIKDRVKKGRSRGPTGESAPLAKLTATKVIELRRLHERNGVSVQDLADRFGIHKATVHKILKGNIWRHV